MHLHYEYIYHDFLMLQEVADVARPLRRVVVTGASGFIGRHLLDRLVGDGVQVLAISRRGTGRRDVEDICVEYSDQAALQVVLRGVDVVVHLAARAHQKFESADSLDIASHYQAANVDTAVAVATAARSVGVRRMVLMSSIGVNGNASGCKPFSLSDSPNPVELYAKSKWAAEQAVAEVLQHGETDFVILRPPLVYGPGCPGNFQSLLRMVAIAPLLPLAGIRVPRTFVSVTNLVGAIVVASIDPRVSRRTFLITDNRDTSVSEIVKTLAKGFGRSPWIVVDVPPALLGVFARIAGKSDAWSKLIAPLQVDGSDFRRVTGWQAPVDPADGLYETARQFLSK